MLEGIFLESLIASLSVFFSSQTFFFWVQLKVWIYLFLAYSMCFSTSIITWKIIFEKRTSFGMFFGHCHDSFTPPIGRKLNFSSQHPLACLLTLHHHLLQFLSFSCCSHCSSSLSCHLVIVFIVFTLFQLFSHCPSV